MNEQDLYDFFAGEASLEQEKEILRWLDLDPAHDRELIRSRKVFDTLLLSDQRRGGFRQRRQRLFPRWARELARVAAVVALVVGCGYHLFNRHVERLAKQTNTIVVPAGQRVNITLPDGTNVWLNSLSELSYPTLFTGGKRQVKLNGEGFFDVTHDAQKPFIVHAGCYDVKVLGTRFDLISSSLRNEFSVSVLEGRVQVTECDNANNSILLSAHQEVRKSGNALVRQAISDADVFRWREGLICFRNTSLEALLKRFEYSYGVEIVVNTASLPKTAFGGKFRISDGIFHALRVLQRDVPFSYKWDEERNIIYIGSDLQPPNR